MTGHGSPKDSAVAAFGEQKWLTPSTTFTATRTRCFGPYGRSIKHALSARSSSSNPPTRANTTRRPTRFAAKPIGRCSAGVRPILRQQPDVALRWSGAVSREDHVEGSPRRSRIFQGLAGAESTRGSPQVSVRAGSRIAICSTVTRWQRLTGPKNCLASCSPGS